MSPSMVSPPGALSAPPPEDTSSAWPGTVPLSCASVGSEALALGGSLRTEKIRLMINDRNIFLKLVFFFLVYEGETLFGSLMGRETTDADKIKKIGKKTKNNNKSK